MIRQSLTRVLLIGWFGTVVTVASGQEAEHPAKGTEKPRVMFAKIAELKAKVDAVDLKKRLVTLTDAKGEKVTVKAGPGIKNLDEVEVGDELMVRYFEATALFVRKGAEPPSAEETLAYALAPEGKEKEAIAVETFEYKATVENVHPILRMLTLKGPDGKTKHFRVHERVKNLGDIKKGDELIVRHTEALAVSLEEPAA